MENEKIVIDSQHRMLAFCQIRDTTGTSRSEILKEVFPDQEVRAVLPTIDCNNLGFKHAHCCLQCANARAFDAYYPCQLHHCVVRHVFLFCLTGKGGDQIN